MVKSKFFKDGLAFAVLIVNGLVPFCDAGHGHHHHKDVLDRVMHKAAASSHGGLDATGTLVEPTNTDRSPFQSIEPSRVSSVPHVEGPNLEQGLASLTTTLGRFRHAVTAKKVIPSEASATGINTHKAKHPGTKTAKFFDYYPVLEKAFQGYLRPKIARRQDSSFQSFSLAPFTTTTPSESVCPAGNTTEYTSAAGIKYQIICNVDFDANNYPFQLVGSFDACVQKCDAYNYDNHGVLCLAALYVPSREGDADDCYLKSSVANPVSSNLGIQGAVRLGPNGTPLFPPVPESTSAGISANTSSTGAILPLVTGSSSNFLNTAGAKISASSFINLSTFLSEPASNSTSTVPITSSVLASTSTTSIQTSSSTSSTPASSSTSIASSASSATSASASPSNVSNAGITYASGNQVIVPQVAGSHLQGPTVNTPSKQWINYVSQPGITLSQSLLTVGVNPDLTTGYPISDQTGALQVDITTQPLLEPLDEVPHLSRDGGRGGYLGGQHLFVFDDTGSYTPPNPDGSFLGFVCSSVAIDVGMNGLFGQPLNLQDGIGEWSDATGRQRGFVPLTEAEQAYNQVLQGNGQRYAVWPESSIIPLDADSGIIFAPIVYDNVNRATNFAVFTYAGATLLTITAGGRGGPVAERTVPRIFDADEIEWGCSGGIRSWGPSGIGGSDGSVYFFGVISGGILAGRTSPDEIANRNSYEYWDGTSFTPTAPTSSSTAFFIQGPFMDIDVFYSPRHLTFIIVYMTIYADSTFYFRYLEADQGILPPFAPNGDASSDYVENIFKYSWSDEQFLYKAPPTLSGRYVYAGGVHAGYYGANDITNGGTRMLLSWTAPTNQDPSSINSEYQIMTAEVDWV